MARWAFASTLVFHPPSPRSMCTLQSYVEATGEQEAAFRELAAVDAETAAAIAQRTARLRQLQETLVQVGGHAGW